MARGQDKLGSAIPRGSRTPRIPVARRPKKPEAAAALYGDNYKTWDKCRDETLKKGAAIQEEKTNEGKDAFKKWLDEEISSCNQALASSLSNSLAQLSDQYDELASNTADKCSDILAKTAEFMNINAESYEKLASEKLGVSKITKLIGPDTVRSLTDPARETVVDCDLDKKQIEQIEAGTQDL